MASTTPQDTAQSSHTNHSTTPKIPPHTTSSLIQSPLLLLLNMSNLMSIKLDYANYIPQKHQLITILEAYSLIEHIDGTAQRPLPFVLDSSGNPTATIRTRSDPISYEQLAIMLQSEKQAMIEHLDLVPNSLAMFAFNSKSNSSHQNQSQSHGSRRGRGRGRNNFNNNKGRGGRFNTNGGQQYGGQYFSPQAG